MLRRLRAILIHAKKLQIQQARVLWLTMIMPAGALNIIRGRVQSAKPIRVLRTAQDFLQMCHGTRRNPFRRHGTEKSGIRLKQGHTTPIRAAVNAVLNAIPITTGTGRSAGSL